MVFIFIYRCPFKALTGIDCPACGMTRACISALKGDFATAVSYHPLYIILGIETAYYILVYTFELKKFKLKGKTELSIVAVTTLLLIFVWIFRVCFKGGM